MTQRSIQKSLILSGIILAFVIGCTTEPKPPIAEKIRKELTIHGSTRIDNYYWMNERQNPGVLEYLKKENNYTNAMMKGTEALQDKLFKEIIGRIKQKDESVPYLDNGYYYYSRFEEGKEYPVYCRKKGNLDAPEEILLDVNELAKGHSFCDISSLNVSPDNKLLAYGIDTLSRRKYVICFKELSTGKLIDSSIPLTIGSAAWANDNKTVFYSVKDDTTLRSYKICRHILGSPVNKDVTVYEEKDPTFSCWVYKSKSKKYLIIRSSTEVTDEYQFLEAEKPDGKFRLFQARERNHEYSIDHMGDKFYIRTNWNAENFRLMETQLNKTDKKNWKDIIPHRKNILLESFELFSDYLVVGERKDGLTHLRIINTMNKAEHDLDFGEEAYTARINVNPNFDTRILRYAYSSLTTPSSIIDYNMETREKKVMKVQEVLGNFDKNNYEARRLWAIASDSTRIPISLVYRKGIKLNGNNPLLLYGYGSYGFPTEPSFSPVRLSLLDRGFIYAIAHIRGGNEMGRHWYEDGKMLHKKNTFTDFTACADYLVAQKYTNPGKLFAIGGSAGGLLMGAVANLRPDLFKGIVAAVPFVDIVTTMLDESIPLTTGEFDEWGNPKEKQYYEYMLSYSPYDNVNAKDYPAMLVLTGLHDSQVQYFEPAKWVAKLRSMKTDKNPLLLKINMEAGHGGASGRFQQFHDTALEYAFICNLLDIKE